MTKETKKEMKTVHIEMTIGTHKLLKTYAILKGKKMEDVLKKIVEDGCKKLCKELGTLMSEVEKTIK